MKLHDYPITPKMLKKFITNFDFSKASGPEFTLVVVLRNCEAEFLYILADLFNTRLKERGLICGLSFFYVVS